MGASGQRETIIESVGRYRILKELGKGGTATVYLAEDPEGGRQVAIKLVRFNTGEGSKWANRVRRLFRIEGTMARVLVVTASPTFVEGGHLVIARALVRACRTCGHEADLWITPQNRFGRQGAAYLAAWLTDVGVGADNSPIDRVVSFRFPSYAVRHPAHVCWLNHRMREYYDLWPRFSAGLSGAARIKERVRRFALHRADRYLLTRRVRRVWAQSRTIQTRLARDGGIKADVLYPPPSQREYRCDSYGDFLLAVSRLTPLKRIDLIIRALSDPASGGGRLVVAGDGPDLASLQRLAAELNVETRVQFVGQVGDRELVDWLARCRAVCFPPFDEDYGFVTVEAFASAKAVLTCRDSGGPTELVQHEINGLIAEPTPHALALAIGRLDGDPALAERLGHAAAEAARRFDWSETVTALLAV
jgi:glycosyltransferase involved in cell wall biosynthesis